MEPSLRKIYGSSGEETMKYIKILNWGAWILFIASLFLPMEHNSPTGPCSLPCTHPFILTVVDNTLIFVLAPPFFLLTLLGWGSFKMISLFAIYSFIGIGEIVLLLTPLLENKINSRFRQDLHLILVLLGIAAILSYGFTSNFRLGIDPLSIGYYDLVLSFLLIFLSSILRIVQHSWKRRSAFKALSA